MASVLVDTTALGVRCATGCQLGGDACVLNSGLKVSILATFFAFLCTYSPALRGVGLEHSIQTGEATTPMTADRAPAESTAGAGALSNQRAHAVQVPSAL